MPAMLEVRDLHVSFPTEDGLVHAVRGTSFSVDADSTLGIVGESGSGKSVCVQTLLGLLPGIEVSGQALLEGRDLLRMSEKELRQVRGHRIGMVFQDPLTSLHPMYTVGWQLVEALRAHESVGRKAARTRAVELLGMVGIPQPARRIDEYPHQFSGGMRQRVMIAMALALRPSVIIADEPTTALDATIQAQVLELLVELQSELHVALVLISHDLGVIADLADEVLVMYAGRPVERGDRHTLYRQPHHPYTRGLLASIPVAGDRGPLPSIPGQPPSLLTTSVGCAFRDRCQHAFDRCAVAEPPPRPIEGAAGHASACWLPAADPPRPIPETPSATSTAPSGTADRGREHTELVVLDHVVKHFTVGSRVPLRSRATVRALNGVSLRVERGEILGIVGETGCGKSTLARCVAGLLAPTSGRVEIGGRDLSTLSKARLRELRRDVQVVFQDPYGSLNPRRQVGSIIAEPLGVHHIASGEESRRRARELMERVGLDPDHYHRYPSEFSGGQRQRVGIARALAVRPKLVICDEPVSALDVSVRAQVINLLQELRHDFGLTYVFISHDLGVVEHVSDRVAVMYLGNVVELGPAEALYRAPRHPYTAALLSAAPIADPVRSAARERIVLRGDVPSPVNPPSGCPFHPRCPRAADRCVTETPPLLPSQHDSRQLVACHYPLDGAAATTSPKGVAR